MIKEMTVWLLVCLYGLQIVHAKVLVVGGTGRVGSQVVAQLLNNNIETNILVRDLHQAGLNPCLTGANLIVGDIANVGDVIKSSEGCDAVISVHGMKPLRFSRLTDLFSNFKKDPIHPYNVNFIGVKNIIAAMEINRVRKLVRVTGGLVSLNPFYWAVALFNILLSQTVKWHEHAEIAIRKSGLDYTVIRPSEIIDRPPLASQADAKPTAKQPKSLFLTTPGGARKKARNSISKFDVADLCVRAVNDPRLSYVTATIGTTPTEIDMPVVQDWDAMINNGQQLSRDSDILRPGPHNLAIGVYKVLIASIFAGAARGVYLIAKLAWKIAKSRLASSV